MINLKKDRENRKKGRKKERKEEKKERKKKKSKLIQTFHLQLQYPLAVTRLPADQANLCSFLEGTFYGKIKQLEKFRKEKKNSDKKIRRYGFEKICFNKLQLAGFL